MYPISDFFVRHSTASTHHIWAIPNASVTWDMVNVCQQGWLHIVIVDVRMVSWSWNSCIYLVSDDSAMNFPDHGTIITSSHKEAYRNVTYFCRAVHIDWKKRYKYVQFFFDGGWCIYFISSDRLGVGLNKLTSTTPTLLKNFKQRSPEGGTPRVRWPCGWMDLSVKAIYISRYMYESTAGLMSIQRSAREWK
jgi:hypothetical protein